MEELEMSTTEGTTLVLCQIVSYPPLEIEHEYGLEDNSTSENKI